MDDEIAAAGVADGEIGHVLEQVERDFVMATHHGVLFSVGMWAVYKRVIFQASPA